MKKYLLLLLIFLAVLTYAADFVPPVAGTAVVTSSFGEFRGSGNRGPHFHMGIDLSTNMRSGVPILAAADGWLVRIEIDDDDIYGNVVVLEHENGMRTLYAHLSKFSPKLDMIINSVISEFGKKRIVINFPSKTFFFKAGEPIGYSGQTGEAAQPHCHFEIRSADESICYDPASFMSFAKPKDAVFSVKSLVIDSERYTYTEGRVYQFKDAYPKIAINAATMLNKNVIGLKNLKMYFNETLVYDINLGEIPLDEFNNVWSVYTNDSVSDGYSYNAWYKLYPDRSTAVVKTNKFAELGRLPSRVNVKIVCTDIWNEEFTLKFVIERR
ncbi:M23 family metallopeptidase [Thermotoga profunda]|uniref:M23 family metallopeptidase n=1 Tax=Thermotoga profunda TaxID=1508420 RepID=UPI0005975ED5|nr:M23 family metallopeptidase [Thermotoga profunda]